jgi:hypothetical protein
VAFGSEANIELSAQNLGMKPASCLYLVVGRCRFAGFDAVNRLIRQP